MNVLELLELRGLRRDESAKFVRHKDSRCDVAELRRAGFLELYQSYQSKPRFDGCSRIVSFLGLEHSRALLIGVYRVGRRIESSEVAPPPEDFPAELAAPGGWFYELAEEPGFEDLKDRVVIDWGSAPLRWVQALAPKTVVEVLPVGYVRDFPGYLNVVLNFDELVNIVTHAEANREWHRMLSSTAGVYLITDQRTGAQYVGSASGVAGILGRWSKYSASGHGGNARLRTIIESDPARRQDLQFSILLTLPRSLPMREVVAQEALYKKKLGSRAFGLNSN